MEKIIMVDGTNLVYRSYYATAYTGNVMRNSKDFPTNAIYGFINMINKIVKEEEPTYMIVAFDKGKTFRHEQYKDYKAGRRETPEELKMQIPLCKEVLKYMGIKYYEIDNYEADDIIGTFAKYCDLEDDFIGTIVSSDKDLLQLISRDVDIKLLKQKDYIRYNVNNFKDEWQIDPINIIDLKALMGDSSDNIPGVAGIGEKTAIKLLVEYKTLDGIYQNIENIKGKLKEKLINDKKNAYMSFDLATINKDVNMEISIKDIKMKERDIPNLCRMYEELEFYSLLKKERTVEKTRNEIKIIDNVDDIDIKEPSSIYIEILGTNYHNSKVLGLGIYNSKQSIYIPGNLLSDSVSKLKNIKYTYDAKKFYVILKWLNKGIEPIEFDTMVATYLLDYNIKMDIASIGNILGYNIPDYEEMYKVKAGVYELKDEKDLINSVVLKAKFIYETREELTNKLKEQECYELFQEIEMPLIEVLADMEYNGILINKDELNKMKEEIDIKIELIEQNIYNMAGKTFNISSPKQLGEILFDTLQLPHGKKIRSGYSTNAEVLEKIKDKHPIVNNILEYRLLTKLKATYIDGLINCIMDDNKIHTIFTNTLTRTGRLSSIEPNLQNIPIRNEYGRLIRKAFVPSDHSIIISGDYSQIELRILAHMADVESLKNAFKENIDIHTKTAADLFKVKIEEVNYNMRRLAKAVNFGIVYGISSYGLAENAKISRIEAKEFIENYLNTYPGIKEYMDDTIKMAHELGYVKTLFKRKRIIPELNSKAYLVRQMGERIALNTPIQGTSADIIKKAMVNIYKRIKKENLKSKMILQVHDELVFDALEEEKEQIIKLLQEEMENVIELTVPLKIDVEYGFNWYQAK